MGFFADLKEDLSHAVNELLPEDKSMVSAKQKEEVVADTVSEAVAKSVEEEVQSEVDFDEDLALEEVLSNIDVQAAEEDVHTVDAEEAAALVEESFAEAAASEENAVVESAVDAEQAESLAEEYTEEKAEENKGVDKKMESNVRAVSDETSIITAGMVITGDINSEGSMDVIGNIIGNIDISGKLNVTGYITGNSKASEIFAEGAKINGEVVSEGAVKIGASSVVIGNISASSAVIAGAVKGDIDVKGPVVLDASAIVMGNIKSKSVQINNGAVIEGMCSQCYADINPTSFFDDYKPEMKKGKLK